MEEQKIYTSDNGSNFANGALMGASLNRGNGADMAAAMMNGMNGMNGFNNPFAYMMFMALFMNGGWNNNHGNAAANAQLQALQTQIADNHNSDLAMQAIQGNQNALNQLAQNLNLGMGQVTQAVATVRDAITAANGNIQLAAQQMISNNNLQTAALGNQVNQGFNGVQRDILSQGYQIQIGNLQQSNLIQGIAANISQLISNGFTQLGFQSEREACSVRENSTANTQKIVDTLNGHWQAETLAENSQLKLQLALAQLPAQVAAAVAANTAAATKANA